MTAAWRHLLARYDDATLRPPESAARPANLDAADQATLAALRRWCLANSERRLAAAVLNGGDHRSASHLAEHLALERDGSWQLAACNGAAARLRLRALTKLHDALAALAWRARQDHDPWDSGHLRSSAAGLQALARFQPRRATLIVADGTAPEALRACWAVLRARQQAYAHPVRLLVVGAANAFAPDAMAAVFTLPSRPQPSARNSPTQSP